MIKKPACLLLTVLMLLCLPSCGAGSRGVRDIISAMSAAEKNAPAGKIYFSDAALGEDEYISEKLVFALYGDGKYPRALEVTDSFAVRISSFSEPYEYAVFKAKTINDTAEIAEMLFRRVDSVKNLNQRYGDEKGMIITNLAEVYISGKFVFLLMTHDNESMLSAAKSALN